MIVKDIDIEKVKSVDDIIRQFYDSGGFTAKKLGEGANIYQKMIEEDYYIFLTFPACIVATGTRGVIKDMVRKKMVNAIITTCGTLDHDLARTFKPYYHGTFFADDIKLHEKGINRLGNIFIPNESYGIIIEEKMNEIAENMQGNMGTREIAWEIGKHLNEKSILYWAWKNKIPVYIPAPTDGAAGWQIWMHSQSKKIGIDMMKDEKELSDIFFTEEKIGGIIIGGGVSKHHLIWWAQFHGGLDRAVYITTASEWDGSLSGARLREAISWGKVKKEAEHVTVEGDATILLPLMVASVMERVSIR